MKLQVGKKIRFTSSISVLSVPESTGIKTKASPNSDLKEGQVDVVVSNSALDRHGEHIMVHGIDPKQFRRNPVVLWAHEYQGLPIGRSIKDWKDNGNFMSRTEFAVKQYPFADMVYRMVVGGFINAVSIGGIIRELDPQDETVIKKLEMIEYSYVPVGAHPDALVVGKSYKKELGISRSELEKEYANFISRSRALDKINSLSENDKNKYIATLKELLGMLEGADSKEPIEARGMQQPIVRRLVLSS